MWGITRLRKGGDHTLAALKSIRAARPDGAPIYVICDNLSANKTPAIRAWAKKYKVRLCFTPTSVVGQSDRGAIRAVAHLHHERLGPPEPHGAGPPQDYLTWRNANARHPDVLAAQRRERARIRIHSERQQRWGRPRPKAA